MAELKVYFPGGVYPDKYVPPIPDFEGFMPVLGDLLGDTSELSLLSSNGTSWLGKTSNGLVLKLAGTSLTYDADGGFSGGTVTSLQVLQGDQKTLVQAVTGIKLSAEDVYDQFQTGSGNHFYEWMMRGDDTITALDGGDDLFGGAGNDKLIGSNHPDGDILSGGEGTDSYDGRGGDDQLQFTDAYSNPAAFRGIDLNATTRVVIDPYGNRETFKSMENFRGTQFRDKMVGSNADEQFSGLGGADFIDGKGGIDGIYFHRDVNFGATRGVTVDLGKGFAVDGFGRRDTVQNIENVRTTRFDDTVTGNAVSNTVQLGEGKDTFVFNTKLDAETNVDTLQDFDAPFDRVQLDDIIFTDLKTVGSARMLVASAFKTMNTADDPDAVVDADDRIIFDATSEEVFYDRDGSGTKYSAIKFAQIGSEIDITNADFFVI